MTIQPRRYSVSEFVERVNELLETQLGVVLVEGELSQPKVWQNKFLFFELKDAQSVVSCFAFRGNVGSVLEEGMHVRVLGSPKLRGKNGRFSLSVEAIELVGEGALRRAYLLMVEKLGSEGLFDPSHKRPLPRFPHHIGLVTSAEGAALGDVRHVLEERWGDFTLSLCPVTVQGASAVSEMIAALTTLTAYKPVDVIILTRGGGSAEDLAAFNDERLARAIFASRVPIIAAIGHDQDVTIAELVADVRAATPSNAAQRAVPDRATVALELDTLYDRSLSTVGEGLREVRELLALGASALELRLDQVRQFVNTQLDQLRALLVARGHQKSEREHRVNELASTATRRVTDQLRQVHQHLNRWNEVSHSLNPRSVLARGYSFTELAESATVVLRVDQAQPGTRLRTHLSDGQLISEVEYVESKAPVVRRAHEAD
ncbi:exodeoxyribonuclease VII large subunit [Candidatus Berkelbacteria bacterium]|nr:exodeoxyribonuclease VII large subunit [Candidatus Berkelbacteria bacterium]